MYSVRWLCVLLLQAALLLPEAYAQDSDLPAQCSICQTVRTKVTGCSGQAAARNRRRQQGGRGRFGGGGGGGGRFGGGERGGFGGGDGFRGGRGGGGEGGGAVAADGAAGGAAGGAVGGSFDPGCVCVNTGFDVAATAGICITCITTVNGRIPDGKSSPISLLAEPLRNLR